MSEKQFAAVTKRLLDNGIELNGPDGILIKDGVTAVYSYGQGVLSVDIANRPPMLPLSLIEGKLRAYLEQSVAYDAHRSAL